MIRTRILTIAVGGALAAFMAGSAQAAIIHMTAGDSVGTSSFNSAGHWDSLAAPAAGNTYTNADPSGSPAYLLRTPGSAGSFAFAGDSLTIASSVAGDLNQSLIFKGVGGSAAAPNVITVNNLILTTGIIRQGSGEADFFALAGNLLINGGGIAVQGPTFINSLVSGSGTAIVYDPGNNSAARTVHFTNPANTFTGSLNLVSNRPSRFELDPTGVYNFVIGANGVNNSIFGPGNAIYDGAFNFDLSAADNTVGDIWAVAAATTQSFTAATFTVNGFTNSGGGVWDKVANGVDYEFAQSTGKLTVLALPEPTTLGLLAVGALGLVARRRK